MRKTLLLITALALFLPTTLKAQNYGYNSGRKVFASPNFDAPQVSSENIENISDEIICNLASNSPAIPLVQTGLDKYTNQRFQEAKEALKTAIRLEPMNPSIWQLYEDVVISEYTTNKRDEILKSVIEADIKPNFAITQVDSYTELGKLYIVGTLKNTSKTKKTKINLKARLFDANKRELKSEYGTLRSIDKVLYPNESSLFEIGFKEPPINMKSFRVEVSSWEN